MTQDSLPAAPIDTVDRRPADSNTASRATRVVMVSQPFDLVYPPVDSSVPLQTVSLAEQLVKRGFDVTVLASRKRPEVLESEVNGVHYRYLSERGSGFLNRTFARLHAALPGRRLPFHASVLSELRYTIDVAIRIRAIEPRIVHVQSFTNFVPVIRALNPGVRFVVHLHSDWIAQMDPAIMRRRAESIDMMLGCSHHVTQGIQAALPGFDRRAVTLFNGVDTDFFTPGPRTPSASPLRLVFLGRVSPEKGLHDLLQALPKIVEAFPDVQLDIVGPDASAPRGFIVDVSDDPKVRQLAEFYDIAERTGVSYLNQLKASIPASLASTVRFCGPANRRQALQHFRNADILINPSLSESFGITLAEAMACEKPTVATDVGGMKGLVVDGETGLLVEPARPDAIAAAVCRLLADPGLRERMGRRGRERVVSLLSWNRLGQQLAASYASLLDRDAASRKPS